MTIVRKIPRKFRISIGGLDCTNSIESYDGGDEKSGYDGLIVFRGKLTLARAMGMETLDDRKNTRWNRGTPITIEITDDFGLMRLAPRGGTLFILSSVYNLETRRLDLECGDSFALLRQREPDGNASGVCIGQGQSKTSVINNLLAAAGAPALIDEVPGTIDIPATKASAGSYIDQAAKMAADSGHILFVDSQNRTRSNAIDIAIIAPILTISILNQTAKYKRIPGESPAAWFVVNSNNQTTKFTQYGYEQTDEAYGPASIAGELSEGTIIIRRERQKESIEGHFRFVESQVYEPVGACIPLRRGSSNLILSQNRMEIFEYESSAFTIGNGSTDRCQAGNQGRLLKRTLTVKQPIGKVLDRVLQSFPQPSADEPDVYTEISAMNLEAMIEGLKEIETFDYGKNVIFTSFSNAVGGAVNPNETPPTDPNTVEQRNTATIRHTLERWEPAGAISPEDYQYVVDDVALNLNLVLLASAPKKSYELIKEWAEIRIDEWVFNERERASYNRYDSASAAESRAKFKQKDAENDSNYYALTFRDMFCALVQSKTLRKVSSSGNTQPPAPDTLPSTKSIKNTPKSFKYKMPFDTAFPFRAKKVEITAEYLSIDGNLLAEKWGKVLWGRFKGITLESEFNQDWWSYTPMCRIDILEPNITIATGDGFEIDRSAYLGEAFSIAIASGDCAIGIDGIFLGFIQNNTLIPPFLDDGFFELSSTVKTIWTTTGEQIITGDITPISVAITITANVATRWATTQNPPSELRFVPLVNTNRDATFSNGSGNAIFNTNTGYKEAYFLDLIWTAPKPDVFGNTPPSVDRYEVSIRKNGGAWSSSVTVPTGRLNLELFGTVIPGLSYPHPTESSKTYVGPGIYEGRVTAIFASGSRSDTIEGGSITYPSRLDYFDITGVPSNVYSGTPVDLDINSTLNTITIAPGYPGYLDPVFNWSIESGPATIDQDGVVLIDSAYINGSTDPSGQKVVVKATVEGYSSLAKYQDLFALDPVGGGITSINIIGPYLNYNLMSRVGQVVTIVNIPSQLDFYGEVIGTGDYNDDVFWSIISGRGDLSRLQTDDRYDVTTLYRPSRDITVRATSQNGTIYQDLEIRFRPTGTINSVAISATNTDSNATGVSGNLNPMDVQLGLYRSEYVVLTSTVLSTGTMSTPYWATVTWTFEGVQSQDLAFYYVGDETIQLQFYKSSIDGFLVTAVATSDYDPTVSARFTMRVKSIVSGLIVVPSVSSIDVNEPFTAQVYFSGTGGEIGPAFVGQKAVDWAISGPGTLATTNTATAQIASGSTAGNIELTATYTPSSGAPIVASIVIPNTGNAPIVDLTGKVLANYSVTLVGQEYDTSYSPNKLKDSIFSTGCRPINNSGDASITLDLGAARTVYAIAISGAYTEYYGSLSSYLNTAFLEYSTNGTQWTTFIQVSDVTDYEFKQYYPQLLARYWRLRRPIYCGAGNINVYVDP